MDPDVSDREWPDLRWCGEPPVLAAEAMEDWLATLRACRPWNDMWLDDVTGGFRAVLEELLQCGGLLPPGVRAARLRAVAREHGAFRRRQGYHALILAEEISVAEDSIVAALMRTGVAPEIVATIRDSLAPVMRATERAAYAGYVDGGELPGFGI